MNDKKQENWPEELKYFERLVDMDEVLFGLNLYAHCRSEIDYAVLCLETVDLWLNRVKSSEEYSKKQNIAITFVLKGRRLLRATQLQLFKGYIPEAEIIFRSVFEMHLVLAFVLEDSTDKRADKYLNLTGQGVWDFRLLCENLLGENSYDIYKGLSQYPHPYNLGRAKLSHHGKLQRSAIHNYEEAGKWLVQFGNATVGLCEQANILFEEDSEWNKKHQEIYDTEIFKKNIKLVKSKADKGDELTLKILSKSKEMEERYKKK